MGATKEGGGGIAAEDTAAILPALRPENPGVGGFVGAEPRLSPSLSPVTAQEQAQEPEQAPAGETTAAAPSKNALKRLRRQQEWEDGREERRKRRREKRQDRRERRREERAAAQLARGADDAPPPEGEEEAARRTQRRGDGALVPVALVVDCDYEAYMSDKERVSLASQVTRCYSDNRNARFRAHLWVAGWRGRLLDRFCNVLGGQHRQWKGVGFAEGDFLACADAARRAMADKPGQVMAESLQRGGPDGDGGGGDDDDGPAAPEPEPDDKGSAPRDVVYLTSESPHTLQRLEPHTVYVVGGLVDRNREKGLCYRRARERGVRTARLPIGQFMLMQSRQVLATNHVVEIMLRWLECGDWGRAFMAVIPKRKGGTLIGDADEADADEADADEADLEAQNESPQQPQESGEPCLKKEEAE